MSKTTKEPLPAVMPEVLAGTTDVSINKDDVITVAVSRAEEMIQAEFASAVEEAAEARKLANEQSTLIQELCQKAAEEYATAPREALVAALRAFGIPARDVQSSVSGQLCSISGRYDYDGEDDDVEAKVIRDVRCRVQLAMHGRSSHFDVTKMLPVPRAVLAALRERASQNRRAAEADARAIEWKRREGSIPQFERKARSVVAEKRLRETRKGTELLDHLLDHVAPAVLKLPSH